MRPILMIEDVTNLHDARYCAAVGISMASFDMSGEDALTPGFVKEISDWLSGLECIGEFGHEKGAEIEEKAKAAGLERVILPWNYDLEEAAGIGYRKMFDAGRFPLNQASIAQLQSMSQRFPDALFLIRFAPGSSEWNILTQDVLAKCILRFDNPDAIYHQLKQQGLRPYGFSLGAFAEDDAGHLDYDSCDAFIHQYQELVPA